jgi:5-methylcytosine-specific restriction endonuclease McrA
VKPVPKRFRCRRYRQPGWAARKLSWLLARDKGRCGFCNVKVVLREGCDDNRPNVATIDHITPRSMGGGDDDSNLILACQMCNKLKGNEPLKPTKVWQKGWRRDGRV